MFYFGNEFNFWCVGVLVYDMLFFNFKVDRSEKDNFLLKYLEKVIELLQVMEDFQVFLGMFLLLMKMRVLVDNIYYDWQKEWFE